MSIEGGATSVRCIGTGVEIHARTLPAGSWPYLLGRHDLVLLVAQPLARLSCRRRVHLVPPSLMAVVARGDVVVLELLGRAECRAVYLPPGALARAAGLPPRPEAHPEQRLVWVSAAPDACQAADRTRGSGDLLYLLEDAALTAERRVRHTEREPIGHPGVWRARDLLLEECARRLTLHDLAEVAGMRRFALAHAFSRELGLPPHSYHTHLRVEMGREMIAGGRPLGTIHSAVGFTDQSHLTRHFKRIFGLTPGRYARALGGAGSRERAAYVGRLGT